MTKKMEGDSENQDQDNELRYILVDKLHIPYILLIYRSK